MSKLRKEFFKRPKQITGLKRENLEGKMTVNRNSSYYPCVSMETRQSKDYDGFYTVEQCNVGIPLRLEIASKLLAGFHSNPQNIKAIDDVGSKEVCLAILDMADTLIQAHNETCEEKGE